MPFENQFALSLEVSRLLPVKLVGDKATEVVMQLARSLQNSGSDIVVEEDLAQIFGKSHIAPRCESSFKTVVVGNAGTSQLYNTIFLQKGPGPTVARAISNPPYLATVIQLSLLSWVHDNGALAAAIAGAMEKRTEDAPVDYSARSAPAQEDIAGVITACDEQTAAFKWNQLLFATAATLGVPRPEATEALNPVIIRGALDMFPMVQKLYEDRLIHVEQHSGLCVLVVWAHHVLGLTTVVRFPDGREKRLGTGTEQILIEMKEDYSSTTSITLLDSKGGDVLLRIQSDQDDFQIESAGRIDAQGYGAHWLKEYCWGIPALEEEMQRIIVAFSMIVSKHLRKDTKWPETKSTEPARSLIKAAQFLFDNERITDSAVEDFVKLYATGQPFDKSDPPETLQAVCRGNDSEGITQATQLWHDMLGNTRCLVVLLIVFSHVRQLEVGACLPLRAPMDMFDHPLVDALAGWDGRSEIVIEDDTWFYGIALLLMGPAALKDPYLDTVSLLSARGWSVHLNVYGNDDPSTMDAGLVAISEGVPIRNEVRKHGIVDGPRSGLAAEDNFWAFEEKVSQDATLRNSNRVELLPTQCSERKDYFAVSTRFRHHLSTGGSLVRRSGFREYHRSLWNVQVSKGCNHSVRIDPKIKLSAGFVTMTGFPPGRVRDEERYRILIFLTANDCTARQRALVGMSYESNAQVMLRSQGCCLRCVVDQALLQQGRWYIIV